MTEEQRLKRNEYVRNWYKKRGYNPQINKVCEYCKMPFKARLDKIRFCSHKCSSSRPKAVKNCLLCGVAFVVKPSHADRRKHCSTSCASRARVGVKAPNWKGGVTEERSRLMGLLDYKNWRKAVFERDNYTCVECGDFTGGNLEADHIKPWSLFPELRLEIDNGRTLCVDCHKLTETWGRKIFTYRKQFRVPRKL